MDWIIDNTQLALKIIGTGVSVITAIVSWMTSRTRMRTRLKNDLEVLGTLDADHEQRPLVEARVKETIDKVYGPRSVKWEHSYGVLALGILMAAGFVWWSVLIVKDLGTSNWWVIATGYGAMTGLYLILWSTGIYDRMETHGATVRKS